MFITRLHNIADFDYLICAKLEEVDCNHPWGKSNNIIFISINLDCIYFSFGFVDSNLNLILIPFSKAGSVRLNKSALYSLNNFHILS